MMSAITVYIGMQQGHVTVCDVMSPRQGAAPIVEAAVEAEMREQGGEYFERSNRRPGNAASRDAEAAAALWRISAELTGAEFPPLDPDADE